MPTERKILEVDESFLIPSMGGVVLAPDLPLPKAAFKSFSSSVIIERADGTRLECEATFNHTHFKMIDGASQWRVTITLKADSKIDLPKGSVVFASEEVASRLE